MRSHSSLRTIFLGATLALVSRSAVAQQFEGVITAKIKAEGPGADVTYSIKGDKLRMDMAAGNRVQAATIVDRAAKKVYVLMPPQQMYMERDLDAANVSAPVERAESKARFSWTGTSQTIAGTRCDDAIVKDDDGTQLNLCIAKGITFFAGGDPMGGRGARRGGWQSHVQGGFPLRVQRAGDADPLLEVTSVQRRSLADDVFTVPSGWRKMEIPMGRPPTPR